ncbi:MAG: VWA domain-containing protein [Parvularculaceae bacterium]|nr:VWA domain-containing protein [Parvularculaceae bacterium]
MAISRSCFRSFGRARHGNVGMMFAMLLLPLLLAGGMAIDLGRKSDARSTIQEAADMAILRASRLKTINPGMSDEELTNAARRIFDSAIAKNSNIEIVSFKADFDPKTDSFNLAVDARLKTVLMSIAGVSNLDLKTLSAVSLGEPPYMEVALVLDNTGSMGSNGKLSAMKKAAAELVESVYSGGETDSLVALVPFSQYVNVGAAGASRFWMKDSGRSERAAGETDETDNSGKGPAQASTARSRRDVISDSEIAAEPRLSKWNGCVGSRSYPDNISDAGFSSKPVPEVYDGTCPNQIQPLTSDKELVLEEIKGMEARGNTYIAGGLEWGWHVLSNRAPFREGLPTAQIRKIGGVKALVVLTDGENTRAPDYPTHKSSNKTLADMLTSRLCEEIKKDEIVVYAISFEVNDAGTESLLRDCATSPDFYFDADNGDDLAEAFRVIAGSLRDITLTR